MYLFVRKEENNITFPPAMLGVCDVLGLDRDESDNHAEFMYLARMCVRRRRRR